MSKQTQLLYYHNHHHHHHQQQQQQTWLTHSDGVSGENKQHKPRSAPTEFRSYVKVEGAVLVSPSLIVLMVSVDVELHLKKKKEEEEEELRAV